MRRRCQRWLRRSAWVFCASTLVMSLSATWVYARLSTAVESEGFALGRNLSAYLGPPGLKPSVHHLHLNGARLRVSTLSVAGDPKELRTRILQRAKKRCREPLSPVEITPTSDERDSLRALKKSSYEALFQVPLVEKRGGSESFVSCLRPRHPLTLPGLRHMAEQLSETEDFASLGAWSGVYLREHNTGIALLAFESVGSFKPAELFPEDGDAPGSDFRVLPRPPGRRILSLAREGNTALTSHQSSHPAPTALRLLRDDVEKTGFRLLSPSSDDEELAFFIQALDRTYIATAIPQESGSTITLAILPE